MASTARSFLVTRMQLKLPKTSRTARLSSCPMPGLFYSMDSTTKTFDKSSFNAAVREMLESHASGSPTPIWDTCYVTHDSFALDVDDLPALELAKAVTRPGGFR